MQEHYCTEQTNNYVLPKHEPFPSAPRHRFLGYPSPTSSGFGLTRGTTYIVRRIVTQSVNECVQSLQLPPGHFEESGMHPAVVWAGPAVVWAGCNVPPRGPPAKWPWRGD